jgi:hypothetical protein
MLTIAQSCRRSAAVIGLRIMTVTPLCLPPSAEDYCVGQSYRTW